MYLLFYTTPQSEVIEELSCISYAWEDTGSESIHPTFK